MPEPQPATPKTADAVLRAIEAHQGSLPKRLALCAKFLLAHPGRIAVSTAAELAAGAGVPPPTLIRFCQTLGFRGFGDLQRVFRAEYAASLPDYPMRLRTLADARQTAVADLLAGFTAAGRTSLQSLQNTVRTDALGQAVALAAGASTLHVIGLRRAFPAASYLAYLLEMLAVPAHLHGAIGQTIAKAGLGATDALVAVTFAPYTPETLHLAEAAQGRGMPVIGVTDATDSPLVPHATALLTVTEAEFGGFRSLSGTMALVMALAVGVATARRSILAAQSKLD